jgi:transcriptional regulator with PAS, ATPase and Fis domain
MNELKKIVHENMHAPAPENDMHPAHTKPKFVHDVEPIVSDMRKYDIQKDSADDIQDTQEITEESLSLADKEIEMIRKALEKHKGKRKHAANELGISERTLYRKIKEFNIE